MPLIGTDHGKGREAVEDRWLSVDEVAEYLGVTRDTIYAWTGAKRLPGHKIGRLWKFKRDEVDGWVRGGGGRSEGPQSAGAGG